MADDEGAALSPPAADHARRPRNYGPLSAFNGHARITGSCGDTMEFWLLVRRDVVEKASFTTDGCASSLACGSVATCLAEGARLEDVASLSQADVLRALGGLPEGTEHCALLAAMALRAALENHLSGGGEPRAPRRGQTEHSRASGAAAPTPPAASNDESGKREMDARLQSRLSQIRHKILVLSGKGGVGKSTIAVNFAVGLSAMGKSVGLLDVDIHGPSIPTMLGVERGQVEAAAAELLPVNVAGVKVLSIGFFLRDLDDAVIWRGPMKMNAIRQFLADVAWGDLDFLVIDSPPGTGDEPLSVIQLIGKLDGAVIVTTPQRVAAVDVRKSITFCRTLHVPILGLVENMSGFACPRCGEVSPIFRSGGGRQISIEMGVPLLGSLPIDPRIAEAGDEGRVLVGSHDACPSAAAMREIVEAIAAVAGSGPKRQDAKSVERRGE